MHSKLQEELKLAAKGFCVKPETEPDIMIYSTEYNLAALVAFHAGANWVIEKLSSNRDGSARKDELGL